MPRFRLNLNLPSELWHVLRDLAARWNCSPDQAIFRLIDRAGGELTPAQDAPRSTISPATLLDPSQPIPRQWDRSTPIQDNIEANGGKYVGPEKFRVHKFRR